MSALTFESVLGELLREYRANGHEIVEQEGVHFARLVADFKAFAVEMTEVNLTRLADALTSSGSAILPDLNDKTHPRFVAGYVAGLHDRKLEGDAHPPVPGHVTEHDPNVSWGKKTFSMTFMEWGYSATHTATVGGNCRAMDNLSSALSHVYDRLPVDQFGTPYMILTDASGDTLQVSDERGRDDDWLMDMLVATHLTSIEPEERP